MNIICENDNLSLEHNSKDLIILSKLLQNKKIKLEIDYEVLNLKKELLELKIKEINLKNNIKRN